MFTGIVEELGEVVGRIDKPDAALLSIRGPVVTSDAAAGDSIAVNGVCLTVVEIVGDVFTADVIGETLRRSSLGSAEVGDRVNLERAAKLGDRLGGHLVQGHVDATGTLLERAAPQAGSEPGGWELIRIGMPAQLGRYLVEKGSITVDGVSFTVIDLSDEDFTIGLIPTTRELTTFGLRAPGELVNLEVDVVAKYVERLTSPHLHARGGGPGR
ncbi:MAG: riboflavin synthase [Pseudonocardiaceae bacterium]|nr:riboflavin synthase [Pseudonocardiaceae bacterium]